MRSPEEAWEILEGRLPAALAARPARRVPRQEALGLSLAEALVATVDQPPADVSAMDGYAVAGEVAVGVAVPVLGIVAAGRPPELTLAPGTAAKIMTGAVMPAGADRVVPVEESDGGTAGGVEEVVLHAVGEAGRHVRRRGEVALRGESLLAAGALLTPGALSLAASHGYGELPVRPRPTVAVIVTGDEVVPPEREPGPGELRDSNSTFLLAAGRSLGLDLRFLGIAPDRPAALRELLARGLESEVLLLSGGVSMGDYDFVEDVLAELGCEVLFDQVAIQPGKPLVAARHDGGFVFGLPGNPGSVMVTFWLFVRPLLRRLMGLADGYWQGALRAELEAPLPAAKGRDRFFAARVRFDAGRLLVTPLVPRGSHDVAAFAGGTALVRARAGAGPAAPGESCEILPLVDWTAG